MVFAVSAVPSKLIQVDYYLQVLVSSPKIVDGVSRPYLVLETNNMSATVTLETWILNASAKLGAIELLDHLNKGKEKFFGLLLLDRNNDGNEKMENYSIQILFGIQLKNHLISLYSYLTEQHLFVSVKATKSRNCKQCERLSICR